MSIDVLQTWKDEWALLPKVSDTSWKQNLADYIAARVDGKLKLQTYTPAGNIAFTFNKTTFIAALAGVDAGTGTGISAIAAGVKNAVISGGLVLTAPISAGTPSPTNTFSIVASSVITAASSVLAEAKINELSSATPVSSASDSLFPVKLREAFLLLTADVIGTDTQAPTPQPKSDLGRAVE